MSDHFGFLTDHGFVQDRDRSRTWAWGTTAVYRSETLAIEIEKSLEFDRVEITLVRLVDGEFPDYDAFFEGDKPLNRTLLDNVVLARRPDLRGTVESLRGLGRQSVARQLAEWSTILRTVASDVLDGSTAAFEDAKRVIADRV